MDDIEDDGLVEGRLEEAEVRALIWTNRAGPPPNRPRAKARGAVGVNADVRGTRAASDGHPDPGAAADVEQPFAIAQRRARGAAGRGCPSRAGAARSERRRRCRAHGRTTSARWAGSGGVPSLRKGLQRGVVEMSARLTPPPANRRRCAGRPRWRCGRRRDAETPWRRARRPAPAARPDRSARDTRRRRGW